MQLLPPGCGRVPRSQGIGFEWLHRQITDLPARQIFLMADCCYSGQLVRSTDKSSKRLWAYRSLTIISSCGEDQKSVCYADEENSPFVAILVDALTGKRKVSAIQVAKHV